MRIWTILIPAVFSFFYSASQDVEQLRENARDFQKQGDYENALLVLNKAATLAPANPDVQKELGTAYYVTRQYQKALDLMKPLSDRPDADEQTFQITGLIYRAQDNLKEADRLYKTALKKFPQSGMLYAEYGDLLELKEPGMGKGIQQWEKGIEMNPAYPRNYYHAAKHYLNTANDIWGLLYGEMFVNLESFTNRTTEIKNLLLDGYKKLYAYGITPEKAKSPFAVNTLEGLRKQGALAGNGIGAETLTAIRTRFILDWTDKNAGQFPFRLYEFHRELLQEGLFDSYNQWLFGSVDNIPAYQNWTANHKSEYADFTRYQRNRIFTIPQGQYYNR